MIGQQPEAVEDRDEHDRTPLMLAAAKGQSDVLRALLALHSDVAAATKSGYGAGGQRET